MQGHCHYYFCFTYINSFCAQKYTYVLGQIYEIYEEFHTKYFVFSKAFFQFCRAYIYCNISVMHSGKEANRSLGFCTNLHQKLK